MNWIRQEKRLAIYLRDGLACVYCGDGVEDHIILTLDHLIPHSRHGTNATWNLVTCCEHCNKSRGNRSLKSWLPAVAKYLNHGVTASKIMKHVNHLTSQDLPMDEAKKLIAHRGSALKAINSL
jgi:hypothetical protein